MRRPRSRNALTAVLTFTMIGTVCGMAAADTSDWIIPEQGDDGRADLSLMTITSDVPRLNDERFELIDQSAPEMRAMALPPVPAPGGALLLSMLISARASRKRR